MSKFSPFQILYTESNLQIVTIRFGLNGHYEEGIKKKDKTHHLFPLFNCDC